jgi:hypothetical protein
MYVHHGRLGKFSWPNCLILSLLIVRLVKELPSEKVLDMSASYKENNFKGENIVFFSKYFAFTLSGKVTLALTQINNTLVLSKINFALYMSKSKI